MKNYIHIDFLKNFNWKLLIVIIIQIITVMWKSLMQVKIMLLDNIGLTMLLMLLLYCICTILARYENEIWNLTGIILGQIKET